ncbi:biotin-dependent carboxyltransferase family protein [Jeongeupia naejangsanensis]|uniref:Biotin-dependent carboxyltransferase family protein n=1 Tax=Jeongeupia naejangsanensis TaxID=613195 RepID=A0ABS2BNT5_9NEIS|nr:biotin-dependent carboxyltransferase family protein [Jeongeupia naejangsanensis]MBM3116723.1 biotin-dependent carboxyltransferase family protein [Jeongeupia naejangsanensis]
MTLTILKPGPQTSVQDLGRDGYAALGVPRGGACDPLSLRLANLVAGNAAGAAALEITLGGLALRFDAPTVFAWAGATMGVTLDGVALSPAHRYAAAKGAVLRFGFAEHGARAYLALAGGIDVAPVLGSRSTGLLAGIGGFKGRALCAGDVIECGEAEPRLPGVAVAQAERGEHLRVLPGPDWPLLGQDAQRQLLRTPWHIGLASNRMGMRLTGTAVDVASASSLASHAVMPGCVQLPPSGEPIVLLADAQTTGGYLRPLVVIRADLWRAGQFKPGDTLRFVEVDTAAALAATTAQRDWLERMRRALAWEGR